MIYNPFNSCRNFDGGFGAVPGAESHAGQIFSCTVGALSIVGALSSVNQDLLGWWLAERLGRIQRAAGETTGRMLFLVNIIDAEYFRKG